MSFDCLSLFSHFDVALFPFLISSLPTRFHISLTSFLHNPYSLQRAIVFRSLVMQKQQLAAYFDRNTLPLLQSVVLNHVG